MYAVINFIGEKLEYTYPEWSKKLAERYSDFQNRYYISQISDDDVEKMLNTRADRLYKIPDHIIYYFYIGDGQSNGYNERGVNIKGGDDD